MRFSGSVASFKPVPVSLLTKTDCLDASMMDDFIRLSDLPREIPLNDIPSFEDNYIDALMLP